MLVLIRRLTPFFLVFFTLAFLEAGITAHYAEARAKFGGRSSSSFRRSTPKQQAPSQYNNTSQGQRSGGFGRGMMGGLLGGALGGLLLGSMFGAGGSGFGILPLIILGVVGFFLYKKFMARPASSSSSGYQPPPNANFQKQAQNFSGPASSPPPVPPIPPIGGAAAGDSGLSEIRQHDPGFDEAHFLEVASDVFFKIQAGWMRRDISTFRHLLGTQLAGEYEQQLTQMKSQGRINKLESIAVRKVEIVDAGSDGSEDFVTILFTANLLDYTVDDKTGDLLEGSMTEPVKFAERWTWARPVRTEEWRLEGIEVVEG